MFDHFHFRYSKLKEHSEGYSATLRVGVISYPGLGTGDVFEGRYQLYGPNSKRDVGNACNDRLRLSKEDGPDWVAMLTAAGRAVVEKLEAGTPLIDLGEGEIAEPNSFILQPVLREKEHTVVFGIGGTGKSVLMLAFAACIDQGIPYLDMVVQQRNVLYLDYEDEEENQRYRLDLLREGWQMEERPHVFYKRAEISLPSMADALAREIEAKNIEYMIVDSAALACGAEPETADAANAYFRTLRGLKLRGSVTIAHQPKEKERSNMPFGSVFWWNNPRSIWQLQKAQLEGEDMLHVGLFHKKANNGRLEPGIGFRLDFSQSKQITVTAERVRDVPDLREHLSAIQQILTAIGEWKSAHRQAAPTRDEIRADLPSIKADTFRQNINRLIKSGKLIERAGRIDLVSEYEDADLQP